MLLVGEILLGVDLLAHDVVPREELRQVLQYFNYFVPSFVRIANQTEVVRDYLVQTSEARQIRPLSARILLENGS